MKLRNGVQLILYADRFGGTIPDSAALVDRIFGGSVTGVHYLPFYVPFDGADAGFDPIDHARPDPRLGTWDDMRAVAENKDICVDIIVNHMSSDSQQFQDLISEGEESPYRELFLTYDDVFPNGASAQDLLTIYRPRPGLPFTTVSLEGGRDLFWTTFTPQQMDINVESDAGHAYLNGILETLANVGVKLIRLDAAGYAIKRQGTSCFMIPETFQFIDDFTAAARVLGMEVLVEIHSHYRTQIEIAKKVDRVYDFAIPPLLLHTLSTGDDEALRAWIDVRPSNAINVLDTHDGIGVIDIGPDTTGDQGDGLLTADQIDALVRTIHANTGGESLQATGGAASNLDLYQVNSTYYDALGRNDEHYLISRAFQFFLPGIPQVYYVGALSGQNDMALLEASGVGRDINRHRYTSDEALADAERPVNRALIRLMDLRTNHPAFDGTFVAFDDEGRLVLRWESQPGDFAELSFLGEDRSATLEWSTASGSERVESLLDLAD
ncbi:MAG: sucrose phosphorylase [Scrofimicrobium sp.]